MDLSVVAALIKLNYCFDYFAICAVWNYSPPEDCEKEDCRFFKSPVKRLGAYPALS